MPTLKVYFHLFIAMGLANCTKANKAGNGPLGSASQQTAAAVVALPDNYEVFGQALLQPRSDSMAMGVVTFAQGRFPEKYFMTASVANVRPGLHGIHIHEFGDCAAHDAMGAGEHFNPTDEQHGGPESLNHHFGDLGNIKVGDDGRGSIALAFAIPTSRVINFRSAILGKAVILHYGEDDLRSQPAGKSGSRIACGVIERVAVDRIAH